MGIEVRTACCPLLSIDSSKMSGYIAATLSAICNGSFCALSKLRPVREAECHPIIFNTYVSFGVGLSSLLCIPVLQYNRTFADKHEAGESFAFEPLGLIAGFLMVCAFTFSFLTIPLVGLSVGQGVWGGAAIIVSFVAGLIVGQSTVKSALIVLALALLLIGVIGIALCEELKEKLDLPCFISSEEEQALHVPHFDQQAPGTETESSSTPSQSGEETTLYVEHDSLKDNEEHLAKTSDKALGIIFSLMTGLAGGSVLVPMQYVSDAHTGLAFVPSLGIGAAAFAPVVPLLYFGYNGQLSSLVIEDLKLGSCLLPGLLAGAIWNIGNTASIWAIPRLGFSVAYPMMQCALLVSALWGVFVFDEIKDKQTIFILFVSGGILLGGAAILSISVDT